MSCKMVGLVAIPVGAFLGAFVQPFVIFGKQGLEGVSSVT